MSMMRMLSFAPHLKTMQLAAGKQRERAGQLYPSEVMTILIHFHPSHYRTFKAYYTEHVQVHLTREFPQLVSYQRFVALMPSVLVPLLAYLHSRYGACTGSSFIDSTSLAVCDPKRISQHRVFATDAKRGKTSMGWFYGFKLHLAVNDRGDLLACCLTPGNVDDRAPVPRLVKGLRGKLFGDRGYISAPLTQLLFEHGLQLITRLRKNMKNHLMHLSDKLLLRKRAIIESIIVWWSQKSRQFLGKNKTKPNHSRKLVLSARIDLRWRLIVQRLMKPLLIVKREVRSQIAHGFGNALVIFDVDLLIFDTAP
jgi:Transposase DDE domain